MKPSILTISRQFGSGGLEMVLSLLKDESFRF